MSFKFLPDILDDFKFEEPYLKLEPGTTHVRAVRPAIVGWVDWSDQKNPVRYRYERKPANASVRMFWATQVWNYDKKGFYVWVIEQQGILKALKAYSDDKDWGNLADFDLKIKREGTTQFDTKYFVTPMPHKPLDPSIKQALAFNVVRLEALFDGGSPWRDLEPSAVDLSFDEQPDNVDGGIQMLVDSIESLISQFPDADKFLANFCKHYNLSDWKKADEIKLSHLEERLTLRVKDKAKSTNGREVQHAAGY